MTVNLPTIPPGYNGNRDGIVGSWRGSDEPGAGAISNYCRCLARKKHKRARPIREFRYNPMRTGEMAEWLKAAVC
jgi:hypothetical protein